MNAELEIEVEEHPDGWMVSGPDGVFAVLKDADGALTGECTCGIDVCGHWEAVIRRQSVIPPVQSPLHPTTPTPPTTRTLASLAIDGQPDLPSWLMGLHPHQWDAVEEVVEH